MLHSRALTQTKKCAPESFTIVMGILPSGRYCSRDCCRIQVCHALKKKKGRKDLHKCKGALYLDGYRGMQRKQLSTRETTRKYTTKRRQKGSKEGLRYFGEIKQQKAKALQTMTEQPGHACSNSTVEINAWLHSGKGNARGLMTEECRAEPAVPTGRPETPLHGQPPEEEPSQELPAGRRRGCR